MRKLVTLSFFLLLAVISHAQSNCGTANAWCQVWPNPSVQVASGFSTDPGWDRVFYVPDTQKVYITALGNVTAGTTDAATTTSSPANNAMFVLDVSRFLDGTTGLPKQADGTTGSPWVEFANSGTTASSWLSGIATSIYHLKDTVAADATSITFCTGTTSGNSDCTSTTSSTAQGFKVPGYMVIGDELVYANSAVDNASTPGTCTGTGWSQCTLTIPSTCIAGNGKPGQGAALCRGLRQTAGYVAATAHVAGEPMWAGVKIAVGANSGIAFGPRINVGGTNPPTFRMAYDASGNELDFPVDRHWYDGVVYDSKRGRMWWGWEWQETFSTNDLYYLPVAVKSGYTTSGDIAAAFRRVSLFTNNASAANNTIGTNAMQETSWLYVPDPVDALVNFGGMNMSGALNTSYIYCLSNTNWGTGGIPADGPFGCAGQLNKWMPVCNTTACHTAHGDFGARDGARAVWDPGHQKVLIFGGRNSQRGTGVQWVSVAQLDPKTGDICLSDTVQDGTGSNPAGHEASGTNCSTTNPLPELSGTQPPVALGAGPPYMPAWTWDSSRNLAVAYIGAGQLYTYDPGLNQWALTSVAGGPTVPSGGKSLAYDAAHDVYVLSVNNTNPTSLWMLPGTAITGVAPSTFNLNVSVDGTGTGAVLDSPQTNINCGTHCAHAYSAGTPVTLIAQPSGGSIFAGWSGACSGTDTCSFTMDADKTVTATFNPPPAPSSTVFSGMTLGGMVIQ